MYATVRTNRKKKNLIIQFTAFAFDTCHHLISGTVFQPDTYICNTEEGYEEGGNNDEEGKQLSVLVEEFKLINQSRDHRFHPTHLQQKAQELD